MSTSSGNPEPTPAAPYEHQEDPMDTTETPTPTPDGYGMGMGMGTGTDASTGTSTPEPQWRRRVRVGTTVWGLVVVAIGLGLLAFAAGAEFDVQLAAIGLIAAAGVALLVGSVLTATGRRRRCRSSTRRCRRCGGWFTSRSRLHDSGVLATQTGRRGLLNTCRLCGARRESERGEGNSGGDHRCSCRPCRRPHWWWYRVARCPFDQPTPEANRGRQRPGAGAPDVGRHDREDA